MDGETNITLEQRTATNLEKRLLQLVLDLEQAGYKIGGETEGGYWIEIPDAGKAPALDAFNMALDEVPGLEAAVNPFLRKHRPAAEIWRAANG